VKRKVFSILATLVLVCSFGLVTVAPVVAEGAPIGDPFFTTSNLGTVEWSTEPAKVGDYSVKLYIPPYDPGRLYDEARVVFNYDGDLTSVAGVSFPSYVIGGNDGDLYPMVVLAVDSTGDEEVDSWVCQWGPYNHDPLENDWETISFNGSSPVHVAGARTDLPEDHYLPYTTVFTESDTLASLKTLWGDFKVLEVKVFMGMFTNLTQVMTAYVDDITINGITYDLEPRVINTTQVKGYNTIQEAIDGADAGNAIIVATGTYSPFSVVGKTSLTIQSSSAVTIQGMQVVTTNYGDRDAVIFVEDSANIVLDSLDIQGQDLGTINEKNYGVIYENSSGKIKDCTVSANTVGDMVSMAIGIWDGSDVTVDSCTIHNFGRVGMLIYNACTVEVLDSTIIGQVYGGEGEVSYGIEVEAPAPELTSACQVTIRGNEIYNCDNTFATWPSWESAAILINGWLEHDVTPLEADCTVIMENNDIHDNYIGIYAVKTLLSYAHYNNIYDNCVYGVISAAAGDTSTAVFDATNNWWGQSSGPGDAISLNVDAEPWLLREGGDSYDKTLSLPTGWSIVSPDAELESWVAVDAEELMYAYGGGGFRTSFVLDSVTPMFIKTEAGGGIGFNYVEDSRGIFTTDLEAGWNLVGIPETNATAEAILSPIRLGTNNEVALATLASQGNYNPSGFSFYESMLNQGGVIPSLYPNDGYWAYMNVAKEFGVVVVPKEG